MRLGETLALLMRFFWCPVVLVSHFRRIHRLTLCNRVKLDGFVLARLDEICFRGVALPLAPTLSDSVEKFVFTVFFEKYELSFMKRT